MLLPILLLTSLGNISWKNVVANTVADITWQYILELRCCQYSCWLHLAIYPGLSIMWERTLVTGRRPDTRGLSPSHHQTHKITLTQNSAHLQIETLQNRFEILLVDYLNWNQFSALIAQIHTNTFFALLEAWMRNTQAQFFFHWMMMTLMQVERILFISSIQSVTTRRWKLWWRWWWWWQWWMMTMIVMMKMMMQEERIPLIPSIPSVTTSFYLLRGNIKALRSAPPKFDINSLKDDFHARLPLSWNSPWNDIFNCDCIVFSACSV